MFSQTPNVRLIVTSFQEFWGGSCALEPLLFVESWFLVRTEIRISGMIFRRWPVLTVTLLFFQIFHRFPFRLK